MKTIGLIAQLSVFLYVAIAGGYELAQRAGLRYNVERSMPIGPYWMSNGPIERGSTVGACLPPTLAQYALKHAILAPGSCPSGVIPVVKSVAAVSGDVVDVSDSVIRINGKPWPDSTIRRVSCSGQHIDMRLPTGRYIIAPNSIFLMGEDQCSWDARYWPIGSISRSTVARWIPLPPFTSQRNEQHS